MWIHIRKYYCVLFDPPLGPGRPSCCIPSVPPPGPPTSTVSWIIRLRGFQAGCKCKDDKYNIPQRHIYYCRLKILIDLSLHLLYIVYYFCVFYKISTTVTYIVAVAKARGSGRSRGSLHPVPARQPVPARLAFVPGQPQGPSRP